ncbi:MAG: Gfo/Idh/MocA family oxidoreductase [Chloroflexota bacterium]
MTVRVGQIGTKHGHARGKWQALVANDAVEAVGIWEPDADARARERQREEYRGARWCVSADELLSDETVAAVAIEGRNDESLAMAHAALDAGKHLWFDKPAGEDWPGFQRLMTSARERGLYVQMGYMFRYQPGFQLVAELSRSGVLGDVFSIRAHMSTWISVEAREVIGVHRGGIFYDLAAHMLDQVVWHLGRPNRTTLYARNDATPDVPGFSDNSLGVFEYDRALAFLDIAAMEPRPNARRFEVYGTRGSAITEPFDPGETVRLALVEPWGGYPAGETIVKLPTVTRQQMYERELAAFLAVLRGEAPPDRLPEHELLVQETLLRATGRISG